MGNVRSRSFDGRYGITGTYETFPPFPSFTILSATAGPYGTCDDTCTGRNEHHTSNAFLCVRKESRFPAYNGILYSGANKVKQLINCPTDYRPGEPSVRSKFGDLSTIDQSNLAWQSLAATNPNVAHASLPTYWAELKDLPLLWRSWGNDALAHADKLWKEVGESGLRTDKAFMRRARALAEHEVTIAERAQLNNLLSFPGKANIWYRWGWRPLVNDILKMFSFQDAVLQRLTWLSRLQTGKRVLKRRATIRNSTDFDTPTTVQLKSVGANIQGRRTCIYTEKVWCTVKWKLLSDVVIPGVGLDFDPLWVKAHQLTFGLTTQDALAALWQIMPWSWFVDWFLHVSTIIDATNNTIPVTSGDICVMRHTNATARVEQLTSSPDAGWCKPTGFHVCSEDRKQRLVVSPILPFAPSMMPVFTTGQWSILGSLAFIRLTAGAIK